MRCAYCDGEDNDFVLLNQTTKYSGIEVALNRQGMLRVRCYTDDSHVWYSQDITEIKFCPNCGRAMNK